MEKISVTVITRNEEKNIERCLESLAWADEIIVLDAHSTDKTVEICRKYTNHVETFDWHGYGKQKNLCADRASHRWVLNIDADEVVSPDCAKAIQRVLQGAPEFPVYRFPRKNLFAGKWVRFGGWYPDKICRLYDKSQVRFTETAVHERLTPDHPVGDISEPLIHYSFSGMEDYIDRQNRYSTLYAEDRKKAGWVAGWSHICLRPLFNFYKNFVLRQGFRDGFLGLFLASSMAFYTFLKYAKTRSIGDPKENNEK